MTHIFFFIFFFSVESLIMALKDHGLEMIKVVKRDTETVIQLNNYKDVNENGIEINEIEMPFADTLQDEQAEMGEISQQKMQKILTTM